jgi:hypothetical protein
MSPRGAECTITEMNRIGLVLFDMTNRILGPYLTAIDSIIISVMCGAARWGKRHVVLGRPAPEDSSTEGVPKP